MRVCYFGVYKPDYSRNRVLITGLKQNGVKVLECNSKKKGILKYIDLAKKHWKIRKDYDVMFVAVPCYDSMILARFLTRKPIVFDGPVSVYETLVLDRKAARRWSVKGAAYWLFDFLSMNFADLVTCGTFAHAKYASRKFYVPEKKFRRVFVGASDDIFYPRDVVNNSGEFRVLFFGKIVLLHGLEHIIRAAKILENQGVIFHIVGGGPAKEKFVEMSEEMGATNVIFGDHLLPREMSEEIAKADLCLGVFSTSDKAQRAIAIKVFECAAMRKPIITSDSPANRELFSGEDIHFVPPANPQAIANAILLLRENKQKRDAMAANAYNKFMQFASTRVLGRELMIIMRALVKQ